MGLIYGPRINETLQTPKSLAERLSFVNFHISNNTNWENTIFSDESWFELIGPRHWVWRKKGDYRPEVCKWKKSHNQKVMIWGAVGYGFKSRLVFIDGIIDSEKYIHEIINASNLVTDANEAYGEGNWTFMQDNASVNKSKPVNSSDSISFNDNLYRSASASG